LNSLTVKNSLHLLIRKQSYMRRAVVKGRREY